MPLNSQISLMPECFFRSSIYAFLKLNWSFFFFGSFFFPGKSVSNAPLLDLTGKKRIAKGTTICVLSDGCWWLWQARSKFRDILDLLEEVCGLKKHGKDIFQPFLSPKPFFIPFLTGNSRATQYLFFLPWSINYSLLPPFLSELSPSKHYPTRNFPMLEPHRLIKTLDRHSLTYVM